jgi:hypothetical protein
MELTLSQVEQANEMARRIGEVLKGCKSGSMDADSLEPWQHGCDRCETLSSLWKKVVNGSIQSALIGLI